MWGIGIIGGIPVGEQGIWIVGSRQQVCGKANGSKGYDSSDYEIVASSASATAKQQEKQGRE